MLVNFVIADGIAAMEGNGLLNDRRTRLHATSRLLERLRGCISIFRRAVFQLRLKAKDLAAHGANKKGYDVSLRIQSPLSYLKPAATLFMSLTVRSDQTRGSCFRAAVVTKSGYSFLMARYRLVASFLVAGRQDFGNDKAPGQIQLLSDRDVCS